MTHFGVICPTATGHINPMMTLCGELQKRGHQITFYQLVDVAAKIRASGFAVQTFGAEKFPPGSVPRIYRQLGELTGEEALKFTLGFFCDRIQACLDEVPHLAREEGIEAFLVDEAGGGEGSTVAEELGVPWITISNALILNESADVPPFFTTWPFEEGSVSRSRNIEAWESFGRMVKPNLTVLNSYREKKGLKVFQNRAQAVSKLAQISQQPKEFEFPRSDLPSNFHFAGPFHADGVRQPVPFPYEKLTGEPLIYASMGTLQNRQEVIFGSIAEACVGLPVQLVISLGGGSEPESLPALKGNPLVLEFVPQLEILKKARLCITHAGLNTVLESLANAVPMVAIPITNDQPGVAARLAWTGAGEFIPVKELTPALLRGAIGRILNQPEYSLKAAVMQAAIRKSGGVSLAADIIERAISQGR